jgi:FkbM family methyltransferase
MCDEPRYVVIRPGGAMRSPVLSLLNALPAPIARRLNTHATTPRLVRFVVNRLVPTGTQAIVVRSGEARGARLLADLRREKYYLTGAYESQLQRALAERLGTGDTFWDVGGHAGFFTVLGARLVGKRGRVHVFEPCPENRRRVEAAVRLNGLGNVSIHECAVSAASGQATLHGHVSTSMWTLVEERAGDERGLPVTVRTLDELADDPGVPDVIKLDVEGAEVDVLHGGSRLLKDAESALLVEFSSPELLAEARTLLPGAGFDRISGNHWALT